MEENEKVINLIRKCLNLSESPNENEAARALEKAQELLQKYNLQMADVKERLDNTELKMVNFPLDFETNLPDWKVKLIFYIAKNNFCDVVTSGKRRIYVLGLPGNISAVLEMSLWITNQVENMAFFATTTYYGERKQAFRNSFVLGCTDRIYHRLKEQKEAWSKSDVKCTSLVIQSDEELNKFKHAEFPTLTVSRKVHSNTSSEGYYAGQKAGNEISLNVQLT